MYNDDDDDDDVIAQSVQLTSFFECFLHELENYVVVSMGNVNKHKHTKLFLMKMYYLDRHVRIIKIIMINYV